MTDLKNNYNVTIKIEKTIFIENVEKETEAIQNAVSYFYELIQQGVRPYMKIVAAKTNDTDDTKELQEEIHEEQVKEINKTSLQLANSFNKSELKLLVEDINFYIRST